MLFEGNHDGNVEQAVHRRASRRKRARRRAERSARLAQDKLKQKDRWTAAIDTDVVSAEVAERAAKIAEEAGDAGRHPPELQERDRGRECRWQARREGAGELHRGAHQALRRGQVLQKVRDDPRGPQADRAAGAGGPEEEEAAELHDRGHP